jgi:hypothetical protein
MCNQDYVNRAKLTPPRTFKSPMNVVETNDIEPAEKLAILKAWEADERALLRAEDEGMGGGEHAHLHEVQAALDPRGPESWAYISGMLAFAAVLIMLWLMRTGRDS